MKAGEMSKRSSSCGQSNHVVIAPHGPSSIHYGRRIVHRGTVYLGSRRPEDIVTSGCYDKSFEVSKAKLYFHYDYSNYRTVFHKTMAAGPNVFPGAVSSIPPHLLAIFKPS